MQGGKIPPKYALFLGCLIPNRYPGIEQSVRKVIEAVGYKDKFTDLPQATCCPVPGIFYSSDKATWLALAARNLCLAQERRLEMVTLCNGCFASLLKATEYLSDSKTMGETNKVLREVLMKYTGIPRVTPEGRRVLEPVKVRHFIDVLYRDVGIEAIKSAVVRPLTGLKIAVHYGCHYLRPTETGEIEDPGQPHMIDDIVGSLGALSVNYHSKLDCCGAGGGVRSHFSGLAAAISRDKYDHIAAAGADCIVTPCPFCLLQLDTVQEQFEGRKIPVLHAAQLIAYAVGIDWKELGFGLHKVPVDGVFSKLGGG